MANPEKEKKDEPKLDAILPDKSGSASENLPPAAAELIGDIDSYQKKMEEQWSTAKDSYEKRINQIMEDFLSKTPKDIPPAKKESEPSRSTEFENVMSRVERELRESGYRARKPSIINISWQPELFRLSPFQKLLGMIGATLIAGAAAVLFYMGSVKVTHLPYAHTLGPVLMNNRIYVVDWFRKALFIHKDTIFNPIEVIENLPSTSATGFAISNKFLYTADGVGKSISRNNLSMDHELVASLEAPGERPVGLFFDGTDLWSGDPISGNIYRHRGNELEDIRDQYAFPGEVSLTSFFLHNNRVWILDGKSRILNVYRLQKPMKLLASIDLDKFLKGSTPTGVARKEKVLYMVTENPSLLVEIPFGKLKKAATISGDDWLD